MACPCCYDCNCETTWLPRAGGLTSVSAAVRRLNCDGYEISNTLVIPQRKPAGGNRVESVKYQQTSNVCLTGVYGRSGLGAAFLDIRFTRCPLDLLIIWQEFYQFRTPGFTPMCDASGLIGQGLDESRSYMGYSGYNIGTRAANANKFITTDGIKWVDLKDACRSIETQEKSFVVPISGFHPSSTADGCVRSVASPSTLIQYEFEVSLEFNPLP